MWGERKFIKVLLESFNMDSGLDIAMKKLSKGINDFRDEAPLKDDITYFMCHYRSAS